MQRHLLPSRPVARAASKALVCSLAAIVALTPSVQACDVLPACDPAKAGESATCPVPGWVDRAFELKLPSSWDGVSSLPVVIAFHGGGGNKESALKTTCPNGDADSPGCLDAVALARQIAVVRPDGTGTRPTTNIRTWNSGGGRDGLNCASGGACNEGVDDVAYFDALLRETSRIVPIDQARVYLAGISNGGSMTYRIACERGERIAAVVAVGTGNQFAARVRGPTNTDVFADPSACPSAVAVLDVHGTEDPCWTYETADTTCLGEGGAKIGSSSTLEGWRVTNGCAADPPDETELADLAADHTRSVHRVYKGCRASLEHIRIEGGGHTWPNGDLYLPESRIGRVARDFGSDRLVDFMLAHSRP